MPQMWKSNSPLPNQSYFLWPLLIVLLRAYRLMVLEHLLTFTIITHWVISILTYILGLILAFKRRLSTGKSSGLKGPIINCWSTANHCKSCIYSLSNQRPTSGSQSRPIHNRSCSKVVSCGPQQIIVT